MPFSRADRRYVPAHMVTSKGPYGSYRHRERAHYVDPRTGSWAARPPGQGTPSGGAAGLVNPPSASAFTADAHLASMSQRAAEVLRRRALAQLPSGQMAQRPGFAPLPGFAPQVQQNAQRAAMAGRNLLRPAQVAPPPPSGPYTTPTPIPRSKYPALPTPYAPPQQPVGHVRLLPRPSIFDVPRRALKRRQ